MANNSVKQLSAEEIAEFKEKFTEVSNFMEIIVFDNVFAFYKCV